MQNMCGSQPREYSVSRRWGFALLGALLVALACALVVLVPAQAQAKSYTMPKVDIQAKVQTDGALQVTEQRTFDFKGDFTAVWWDFENLPEKASIKVNGVRMANVDDKGAVVGDWTVMPSESFVLSWRDSGGPGKDAYSLDDPQNSVYVFFNASNERRVIELDYTITDGAQAYQDVGEVYWKYVGSKWKVDSNNVSMTMALPVPQGSEVTPGDTVRGWGHGPVDGKVAVNTDGTVTYRVPRVAAGQYAEARVLFPVAWLTNLSPASAQLHQGEKRLEQVLQKEKTWADQANRDRIQSLIFIVGCVFICVLLIAWALRAYFKYGREYRPSFTDEYWRDVPDPHIHPALIGRLWRWDRESQDDFIATLMHLAHSGAIRIDSGSYKASGALGREKEVADYYITKLPAAGEVTNPIDQKTLELLFDRFANGADALWFGTIKKYGKDHPQEFVNAMRSWQGNLSGQANQEDFFEMKGKQYRGYLIALAVVLMVASAFICINMLNFVPLIFAIPTAIALGVIANYMPRRSVKGNELTAKSKALRNWLTDFSSLDERPPTDVKVWGEFMVYAYLFGVADQAIKQLQTTMPQMFESDDSLGATYVPWWFWYTGYHTAAGAVMPSMGDVLHTSMANTLSTAQSALSGASGNFSSGGGFGGGFSGGGGGGFGGGGGGAR